MKALKSTINTPAMERKVITAAHKYFHRQNGINAVYEHGHWWAIVENTHNQYSVCYDVVDAEGGNSINGFYFEEV